MGARADGSPLRASPTRTTGTTWVVSRHLLVAQAVSAALASVGLQVHAIPWDAAGWTLGMPHTRMLGSGEVGSEDVVVILDDVETPAAIEEINRLAAAADARVVVVTSHPPDVWWGGLVESDAVEVVGMALSVQQLADIVGRFVAGDSLMEPEQRAALRAEWAEAVARRQRLMELMGTLSPKERHVLELLASGRRVTEIGQQLGVSSSTVRSHVKSLRGKLGAHTQLAAVAMLIHLRETATTTPFVPRPRRESG